uniref:Choline transporter-like protein n=1 Tax=Pseudo-nitzschia australis TaxID=44445 RepID=A0A7S4AP59_9STRA
MDDDNDDDSDNDNDNHVMARVTSNNTPGGRFRPFGNRNGNWRTRLRRKQWPKDISWAVAFWMIVPIGLFAPLVRYGGSSNNNSNTGSSLETSWLAAATSPRSATLHTLTWGLIAAAVLLPRLLYRTSGGVGPGDDARHFASQLLLASAPVSACVYLGLLAGTYLMLPDAFFPYGLIPLWYLARDLYLFRRWKMTATTPGGRQAFFQALACAALDILSRSLKRKVFYRAVVLVILGQFGVIALWRLSLLAALRSGSLVWAAGAFLGGKWATGTVARLLTLTACGGVSNWFAEQSSLIEGMHQMMEGQGRQDGKRDYVEDNGNGRDNGKDDDNDNDNNQETTIEFSSLSPRDQKGQSDGYGNGNRTVSANANGKRLYRSDDSGRNRTEDNNNMPEAYRMADASQYRSTVGTGMDGDFESDDDESLRDEDSDDEDDYASFLNDSARRTTNHLLAQRRRHRRQERHQRKERRDARSSTVRQLMASGLSVSFGSVTKCGLLGGLAQLVWSQIRKIDHARATLGGMRGMPIGGGSSSSSSSSLSNSQVIMKRINSVARNFVRAHSDMAMSYVADYQMSYTRAAQEVAILVDEAGVEPIIHDDISTHMSACVGGSVSGVIILFTGAILVHQRNRNDPGVPDSAVALDMVIAFFFCYTLIFTVMEPLRASIKAVYVCFAQHPEALSQAYPLIFHRLSRMSQSNLR